jgi:hypothetical protein
VTRYDYEVGQQLAATDPPFDALIQAAYRRADTTNAAVLAAAFPEQVADLRARYEAPGGILPGEQA